MLQSSDNSQAEKNGSSTDAKRLKKSLPDSITKYYSPYKKCTPNSIQSLSIGPFKIDSRYTITDVINSCSAAAIDNLSEDKESRVFIEKHDFKYENTYSGRKLLRKIKILRLLKHENIVSITSLLLPDSREDFQELYICSPLMETDLASVIRSPQPLSNEHIQFFIYQVLRGVKYLHSAGIIHTDLKPRHLLINSNCDLEITGLSSTIIIHIPMNSSNISSDEVLSFWCKAPEQLLISDEYRASWDVWAIGCILVELIMRRPFLQGQCYRSQLEMIFDVVGNFSEEFIRVQKSKIQNYLKSFPKRDPKNLEKLLPIGTDPLAIDLVQKLLTLDWRDRITVEEALQHPYLKALYFPHDEPIRDLLPKQEFSFQGHRLSFQQIKDMIYEEILLYHFPEFSKRYFAKIDANENPYENVIRNENAPKSLTGNDSSDDD